jgi:hypothetical protein
VSVQVANIYIPFDRGPGAQANIERWRKMAQLFARTGVVRTKFMQWRGNGTGRTYSFLRAPVG